MSTSCIFEIQLPATGDRLFGLLAFTSWVFVIPLARFAMDRPDIFVERAFSRVGTLERPFPAPVWQLVL
ncbi:MAG: hypothetical protein U0Z26_07965 [Anaerolineales bacterium]